MVEPRVTEVRTLAVTLEAIPEAIPEATTVAVVTMPLMRTE
jgi:hypothetical protein